MKKLPILLISCLAVFSVLTLIPTGAAEAASVSINSINPNPAGVGGEVLITVTANGTQLTGVSLNIDGKMEELHICREGGTSTGAPVKSCVYGFKKTFTSAKQYTLQAIAYSLSENFASTPEQTLSVLTVSSFCAGKALRGVGGCDSDNYCCAGIGLKCSGDSNSLGQCYDPNLNLAEGTSCINDSECANNKCWGGICNKSGGAPAASTPSAPSGNCGARGAGGCSSDSYCCAGLKCNGSPTSFGQCYDPNLNYTEGVACINDSECQGNKCWGGVCNKSGGSSGGNWIFSLSAACQSEASTCPSNQICNPLGYKSIECLIDTIIRFLISIGLPISAIMFVIAGVMFVISAGDAGKIRTARSIMIYTSVGLAVILLASGLAKVLQSLLGG